MSEPNANMLADAQAPPENVNVLPGDENNENNVANRVRYRPSGTLVSNTR